MPAQTRKPIPPADIDAATELAGRMLETTKQLESAIKNGGDRFEINQQISKNHKECQELLASFALKEKEYTNIKQKNPHDPQLKGLVKFAESAALLRDIVKHARKIISNDIIQSNGSVYSKAVKGLAAEDIVDVTRQMKNEINARERQMKLEQKFPTVPVHTPRNSPRR